MNGNTIKDVQDFFDTIGRLTNLIEQVSHTTDRGELTKVDAEIGATLRSLQFGIGVVAIDIKKEVNARMRGLVSDKPAEPVKEEEPAKEEPKKKPAKKTTKKGAKKK